MKELMDRSEIQKINLGTWSHLLKKSIIENIFGTMIWNL